MGGLHSHIGKSPETIDDGTQKSIVLLNRDRTGKALINLSQNGNAVIQVSVLDERYRDDDFRFVVNTSFRSLQNAIDAENYVMTQYNNILLGIADGTIEEYQNGMSTSEKFFSDMVNIINLNSENPVAQKQKIKQLENAVEEVNSISMEKENIMYQQSNELFEKDTIIEEKEREIELLKESINSLITGS